MHIINSIGRKSDLIVAKLNNGKTVFGNSLNDLKSKVSSLAKHWNFSSSDAVSELDELFKQARNNNLVWNASSSVDGNIDYIDNYLNIRKANSSLFIR